MTLRWQILSLAAVGFAAVSQASEAAPGPQPSQEPPALAPSSACRDGVWIGTLGRIPISMQLLVNGEGHAVGHYYYRGALGELFLQRRPDTIEWQERDTAGKATGRLRLSCDGNRLQGEWRSTDGVRRLPVAATRGSDDQFSQARRDALQPQSTSTGTFQRHRFERLGYGAQAVNVQGLRLLGNGPGLVAVNATLQAATAEAVMEHLACKATEVLDPGPGLNFDSEFQQEILAWNELHVVIRTHSQGFCGIGNSWREDVVSTYRVNTGAQVDMRAWLRSEYQQSIAEDSALHRLLLRAYASSSVADMEACKNQIGWTSKDLYGLPGAVVFAAPTLSPLSAACTADVTVPLSQIQPFLSPEGKRAMQAYR